MLVCKDIIANATKHAVQPISAAAEAIGLRFIAKAIMTDEAGKSQKFSRS